MDWKDIIGIILFVVICVPVLAVVARYTLRPIVEAIIRLREGLSSAVSPMVERRVLELEDEVRQLRAGVAQLEATVEFQQKLLATTSEQPVPAAQA